MYVMFCDVCKSMVVVPTKLRSFHLLDGQTFKQDPTDLRVIQMYIKDSVGYNSTDLE